MRRGHREPFSAPGTQCATLSVGNPWRSRPSARRRHTSRMGARPFEVQGGSLSCGALECGCPSGQAAAAAAAFLAHMRSILTCVGTRMRGLEGEGSSSNPPENPPPDAVPHAATNMLPPPSGPCRKFWLKEHSRGLSHPSNRCFLLTRDRRITRVKAGTAQVCSQDFPWLENALT